MQPRRSLQWKQFVKKVLIQLPLLPELIWADRLCSIHVCAVLDELRSSKKPSQRCSQFITDAQMRACGVTRSSQGALPVDTEQLNEPEAHTMV